MKSLMRWILPVSASRSGKMLAATWGHGASLHSEEIPRKLGLEFRRVSFGCRTARQPRRRREYAQAFRTEAGVADY